MKQDKTTPKGTGPETSDPAGQPIPVIGLSGGIGSGKTLVAEELAGLGCAVIDADKLAKQMRDLPQTRQILRAKLGDGIFKTDGEIDDKALAELVFGPGSPEYALTTLNSVVHPLVIDKCLELIAQYRRQSLVPAVVLDAPLLFEAGLDNCCDVLIFVDSTPALRSRRVQDQRGWPQAQWDAREKKQISLDKKQGLSDYVVENYSSTTNLRRQVQRLFPRISGYTSSKQQSRLLSRPPAGPSETALDRLDKDGEKVSKFLRPKQEP